MSSHKREYQSKKRNDQALQTRARILAAAKELFQTEGFELVTIEKVARSSGVSAPTVYAIFQSKRGILRAIMDEALPSIEREEILKAAKEEKSARKWPVYAAKIARQLYDAERAQMDIFKSAPFLSPEFKEVEKEREMRRYERQEESVREMAAENCLLKGLSITKARDILWAFTGRDLYRMLVVEQGWDSDEYERWLAQLLVKILINPNEL